MPPVRAGTTTGTWRAGRWVPSCIAAALVRFAWDTLLTYRHFYLFAAGYLGVQAAALTLIVLRVPYTEIDFSTYLEQAQRYVDGERDYSRIGGKSGPCVYPAAHLYLHAAFLRVLRWFPHAHLASATRRVVGHMPQNANPVARFEAGMEDQLVSQILFVLLALATSAIVLDLYHLASDALERQTRQRTGASVPPQTGWRSIFRFVADLGLRPASPIPPVLLLWPLLSKRLHSIYVLRMFNDPWALALLYFSVWALLRLRTPSTACVLFSTALGIKMNVLLFLPALGATLEHVYGLAAIVPASLIPLIQLVLAAPFLRSFPRQYWAAAFDFGRQFEHRWTVNWRMVPEHVFLSTAFARLLLLGHAAVLAAFLLYRWTPISRIGLKPWITSDLLRSPAPRPAPDACTCAPPACAYALHASAPAQHPADPPPRTPPSPDRVFFSRPDAARTTSRPRRARHRKPGRHHLQPQPPLPVLQLVRPPASAALGRRAPACRCQNGRAPRRDRRVEHLPVFCFILHRAPRRSCPVAHRPLAQPMVLCPAGPLNPSTYPTSACTSLWACVAQDAMRVTRRLSICKTHP